MENRKSFNADALIAGFVIGLALFAVDVLSAIMKWDLTGTTGIRNLLIVAILIGGTIHFTRKRAVLAGGAGMSYGQCLGFMASSMLYAGILLGIGDVILYKMIVPAYYNEVVDNSIKESYRLLRRNPLFAGNRDQLQQSLDMSRVIMHSPVMIILRSVFGTVILGVLVGLFTSAFCKRPADPFYESENER